MKTNKQLRFLVLAVALLAVGRQITASGWNSASPAYRAQIHAFLDGRLALTDAPASGIADADTGSGTGRGRQ